MQIKRRKLNDKPASLSVLPADVCGIIGEFTNVPALSKTLQSCLFQPIEKHFNSNNGLRDYIESLETKGNQGKFVLLHLPVGTSELLDMIETHNRKKSTKTKLIVDNLHLEEIPVGYKFGSRLSKLTLAGKFNRILAPGTLHPNLRSLTLGDSFDQLLEPGVLPPNLEEMTFGDSFNQLLGPLTLPPDLQRLTFGKRFNQRINEGVLPTKIRSLTFGDDFNQLLADEIDNVHRTNHTFGSEHSNLENLIFGDNFNCPVVGLPLKLKSLTFGVNFNQPVSNLPTNLPHLVGLRPPGWLPESLTELIFGYDFNQNIDLRLLPIGLKVLVFGDEFRKVIDTKLLPRNLDKLVVGRRFDLANLDYGSMPPVENFTYWRTYTSNG